MISVVMPVYNGERYLQAAVSSVLAQSHPELELVAVDDGSTDGSPEILAFNARRDPRVRVLRQENRGPAAARNRGIAEARGEFVAMLDQDDVALPDRLAVQLGAARRDPEVLLWSADAIKVSADGRELGVYAVGPATREEYDAFRRRGEAMLLHGPTFFARKDIYLTVGGYLPELALVDDTDLANRVAELGPIRRLAQPLNLHRYHAASATFGAFFEQAELAAFVWARTAARAAGQDLSLEEFAASRPRDVVRRLRRASIVRSRFYFRRGGIALAEGRKAAASGEFARSAVCDPPYFARRVRELLSARRSDPQQQGVTLPATAAQGSRADAATAARELEGQRE